MVKKIILLVFIYSCFHAKAQYFEKYYGTNNGEIKKELFSFNKRFEKYKFIVFGEEHFREENIEIQYKMFEYMYLNQDVKHFLIEYGPSRSILINLYLETGNIKFLNQTSAFKEDILLYIKLKSFYDNLVDSNKFKVHGIDYEKRGVSGVKNSITELILYIEAKYGSISNHSIKFLKTQDSTNDFNGESKKLILTFLEELKRFPEEYEKEYTHYYDDLMALYQAFRINKKIEKKNKTFVSTREELIYKQVISLNKRYPTDNFFCVFGTSHIALTNQDGWARFIGYEGFITKINTRDESPFNSKVLSIMHLYKSCIPPWKKSYAKENFGLSRKNLRELDDKSKGSTYTIFEVPNKTEEQKRFKKNYYQLILVNRF